jgi:surface antigen
MVQSNGTREGTRLRRLAALAPVIGLLSGYGLSLSLLPSADEPYRTELADWQRNQLLAAQLGAMPQEVADGLPYEQIADAARFLTRTLETAPNGQKRHWKSLNRKAVLDIRLVSTTTDGEAICRQAVLSLETAETSRDYKLQACRLRNGTWTK